jgi:hypothetical protein
VGKLRDMGLWLVKRVAAVVARNNLFEQDGERDAQAPLEPDAWAGPGPGDHKTDGKENRS